jgi:hypothetical protein
LQAAAAAVGGSPPPHEKNGGAPPQAHAAAGGLTELQVWNAPPINRHLLICHAPGEDGSNPMNLVSVAVRDNRNFLKKMAVRARRVSDRRFALEGPCPRWRGKW